jgi:uncharacterized protein YndB with AHSA1/START domain
MNQTRKDPTMGTVQLHRVFAAPPKRVYRAFLDAEAIAKWMPPHGFTCNVFELNATVGGRYRMHFTNLGNGQRHAFGGIYQALVPFERIVHTDVFEDSNLPGEMRVTVTFKAVSCGTEVHIVQEGIPAVIPVEGCYLGWQQSLQLLALLVEAEVAG